MLQTTGFYENSKPKLNEAHIFGIDCSDVDH